MLKEIKRWVRLFVAHWPWLLLAWLAGLLLGLALIVAPVAAPLLPQMHSLGDLWQVITFALYR